MLLQLPFEREGEARKGTWNQEKDQGESGHTQHWPVSPGVCAPHREAPSLAKCFPALRPGRRCVWSPVPSLRPHWQLSLTRLPQEGTGASGQGTGLTATPRTGEGGGAQALPAWEAIVTPAHFVCRQKPFFSLILILCMLSQMEGEMKDCLVRMMESSIK